MSYYPDGYPSWLDYALADVTGIENLTSMYARAELAAIRQRAADLERLSA